MSQAVSDRVRESKLPTIVVSDTHRLAPWADALYSCDAKWWVTHREDALNFKGLKITQDDSVPFPQVMLLRRTGHEGFDPDPGCIRSGYNSGYQALHIAVQAGATRVLLCGYDMRWIGRQSHWFGSHPAQLVDSDPLVFARRFVPAFATISRTLKEMGVEVINCTPDSALRCFRVMKLDDALAGVVDGQRTDSGSSVSRADVRP
jgi:hypothetical protein